MSVLDEINQDIGVFMSRMNELTDSGKRELLMSMFKKHLILNTGELVLDRYDLYLVLHRAKTMFSTESIPTKIGNEDITSTEATNMILLEAGFELLNSKGALKRYPKFKGR